MATGVGALRQSPVGKLALAKAQAAWGGAAASTQCVWLRAGAHTPTPTLCVGVEDGVTV